MAEASVGRLVSMEGKAAWEASAAMLRRPRPFPRPLTRFSPKFVNNNHCSRLLWVPGPAAAARERLVRALLRAVSVSRSALTRARGARPRSRAGSRRRAEGCLSRGDSRGSGDGSRFCRCAAPAQAP